MNTFLTKLSRALVKTLALVGLATIVLAGWLMSGHSTGLDRFVTESQAPEPAEAIVCVSGGIGQHRLPTPEGWDRVYTAVQLHAAGLAPVIVFSGGGAERVSEAEVYAEAARWLGCPASAIVLDPMPGSTAEHPGNLLRLEALRIDRGTRLLVVTSRLHSKRVAMCFRKAGFTWVRLVTDYEARDSAVARSRLTSELRSFAPNGKDYGDPLNRLRWGLNDVVVSLRELLALGFYWLKGRA